MDGHFQGRVDCLQSPWLGLMARVLAARFLPRFDRQWLGNGVLFWLLARTGQEWRTLIVPVTGVPKVIYSTSSFRKGDMGQR